MATPHRTLPTLTQQEIERFWSKMDRRGADECWPWTGCDFGKGYGAFQLRRKTYRANRIALFLKSGEDPGEMEACHTCDNPPCCNPAHLFKGTRLDNYLDAEAKGRLDTCRGQNHYSHRTPGYRVGERNGRAKLTADNVRAIRAERAAGNTLTSIGLKYGIVHGSVLRIVNRHSWKHVT